MDYRLKVKKKAASSYSDIDLFPDATIDFELDFYNVDNIDKLRVPIGVSLSIPMTENNTAVIDYDPRGTTYTTNPTTPFDFDLLLNGTSILIGNMYVESFDFNNAIPVVNVRLVDKIQEIFQIAKEKTMYDLYSDYNSLTSFDQFLSSQSGFIGTSPTMEDVMFPYIDFCNDTNKFGYAARQFIQFGFDSDRAGFVPAIRVKDFVDRFFTAAGSGVTSRFFELGNYTSSIPGNNPSDLYMAIPGKLLSSTRSRTRGLILVEGPYEYFVNNFTGDANLVNTSSLERDSFPLQTFGWNYNGTPGSNPVDTDYGLNYTTNVPNDGTDVARAYFGPHMSFTSRATAQDTTIGTGWVGFEMPMIKTSAGSYNMVKEIYPSTSTAKIVFNAVIWKDGSPAERLRMCNSDGSIKQLNVSDATVAEITSGSTYDYWGVYTHPQGHRVKDYINVTDTQWKTVLNCQLRFDTNDIGDFIWERKEVAIDAGSTYAVTIEVEWVSGDIDVQYVSTWQPYFNMTSMADDGVIPDQLATKSVGSEEMIKGVYREDPNNVGVLYTALLATGTHNPYFNDDDINLRWMFEELSITPYDVMKEIIARFNLSAVYDQNSDNVLIDRLPDIRSLNTSTNITSRVDDRENISVEVVSRLAKSLEISTSANGLFFDEEGYGVTDLNLAGSDDLKFSLTSRFYNKSLCGDETFIEIPEGFNEYEIGFTENAFTKRTEIGIVFGYIDTPNYKTNIRRARFVERNGYKGLIYETMRGHVFPRFVSSKPNSLPLRYFDELDQPTELYDFFIENDNINFYNSSKVSFTAFFDTDYGFDIKNNYSDVTMDFLGSNQIIIKSFKGKVYDLGIYGEVEAIIL
jgi:hypothetical protein